MKAHPKERTASLLAALDSSTPDEQEIIKQLCDEVRENTHSDVLSQRLGKIGCLEILASIGLLADMQAEAQREEETHDGAID